MFRRRRSADDFAQQIQSHLELEADELQREGVSADEARQRARSSSATCARHRNASV